MAQLLHPDDPRLAWQGAISLQRTDEWVMPWRIPYKQRSLFPPNTLAERAAMPAGVRIAFHSDTVLVGGQIVPNQEAATLDLCLDGQLHGSVALAGREQFRFEGLPAGDKLIELWLPQGRAFRLRSLDVTEGATVTPYGDPRPRWITYGSSITHGGSADQPTGTWPAIVARQHGLNLTCLGYGGNCHLEPMVARMIRDLPADFLSMKVGININSGGTLNARTFRPAVIGFVQIVREKHPDTPFAVVSPICSPPREDTPNTVGFTLPAMRQEVAAAVSALQAQGDRHLRYIDGLAMFGPELAHLLPDQLHPNAEGYRALAQNFLREVAVPRFRR